MGQAQDLDNQYTSESELPPPTVQKSKAEWKQILGKEQFDVCIQKGTERAFSGALNKHKEHGTYACACCNNKLFESDKKFDSGTGWPSFTNANKDAVLYIVDKSHFMTRTEVICKQCHAHLGHVFPDGPKKPDQIARYNRYCINSVCLKFEKL